MKILVTLNLNDLVTMQLTEEGAKKFNKVRSEHRKHLVERNGSQTPMMKRIIDQLEVEVPVGQFIHIPIWEVMQFFGGETFGMISETPFVNNEIVVQRDPGNNPA